MLDAIANTGLPIPAVTGYVDRGEDVWLALGKLQGVQLPSALNAATPERRRGLAQALGALRRVHDTPIPQALQSSQPWDDRMIEWARGNLAWCDGTAPLLNELYSTGRRHSSTATSDSTTCWSRAIGCS